MGSLVVVATAIIPAVRVWSVQHLGVGPAAPVIRWAAEDLHLGPTVHVKVYEGCGEVATRAWGTYWLGRASHLDPSSDEASDPGVLRLVGPHRAAVGVRGEVVHLWRLPNPVMFACGAAIQ